MYRRAIEQSGLAVVTGAASGVGKAAAQKFMEDGLGVVLVDLPGEALENAAADLNAISGVSVSVAAIPTDVSDATAMRDTADQVFGLGEVAVLMNNAGIAIPSGSWENSENWRKLLEVNLFGVMNGTHAFLPRMTAANRPAVVITPVQSRGSPHHPVTLHTMSAKLRLR